MVVYKEVWIPLIIQELNICLVCKKQLPNSVGAHCQRSKTHKRTKQLYIKNQYDKLINQNFNNFISNNYLRKLKSYFRISNINHRIFEKNQITIIVLFQEPDDYINHYYFKLYLENLNITVLLFRNAIIDIETNQTQLHAFFGDD